MKGITSKTSRHLKDGIKFFSAILLARVFGKKSYPLFGLATGTTSWKKERQILFQETTFQHKLPETVHPEIFWKFKNALQEEIPEEGTFVVPEATATKRGEILLKNGKLIKTYLSPHKGKKIDKLDLFRLSFSRVSPKIFYAKSPVTVIASGWQDAFFHWMYEVLPRIELANNYNHPIYVANNHSFQKESLKLLGIENSINANEFDGISAPEMVVTSTPIPPIPRSIRFLREMILPKISPSKAKRLYISRHDASRRRILNEEALLTLLEKYGFERVLTAHLPFTEQVKLFRNAEVIVAPHGAALSHLAFCDPGTPVLEIFSPAYVHTCYWRLSNFASLPYYYIIGEGEKYPEYVDPHLDPDITVDTKKVEASLKLIGL